jgi:hypothetical protein
LRRLLSFIAIHRQDGVLLAFLLVAIDSGRGGGGLAPCPAVLMSILGTNMI